MQVLRHPHVDAISAVLCTFRVPSSSNKAQETIKHNGKAIEVHVDIVCTFYAKPVWIVVSDRNPKYSYWLDEGDNFKGWRSRVQVLVHVAQSLCVLRPSAVLFCFARGVSSSLLTGFQTDVGASQVQLFKEPCSNCSVSQGLEVGDTQIIERDDGDWVCIYMCEEEADLDTSFQKLQHSRISSTLNASLKHWITFQVDISAPLDGYHALQCEGLDTKALVKRSFSEERLVTASNIEINSQEDALTVCKLDGLEQNIHSRSDACNDTFLSCLSMLGRHVSLSGKDQDRLPTSNLVNLDTTALIALVSEVSNGAAPTLVNMCHEDLVSKFKSTAQFMRDQAEEELKGPLLLELTDIFECRRPFMSETVCKEFKSLVSLCGSFKEKTRAEELLRVIPVVPDTPSSRVMNLCETGKIKDKNKIIFGTGDFWQAPTLTANLSLVRAVRQTGMALSILEHKPRALVGEKCG